jgi:hypothetical protein
MRSQCRAYLGKGIVQPQQVLALAQPCYVPGDGVGFKQGASIFDQKGRDLQYSR